MPAPVSGESPNNQVTRSQLTISLGVAETRCLSNDVMLKVNKMSLTFRHRAAAAAAEKREDVYIQSMKDYKHYPLRVLQLFLVRVRALTIFSAGWSAAAAAALVAAASMGKLVRSKCTLMDCIKEEERGSHGAKRVVSSVKKASSSERETFSVPATNQHPQQYPRSYTPSSSTTTTSSWRSRIRIYYCDSTERRTRAS
uniref:Uncharacterized protein n=1 Tax=Trichogramma kaykai TaxID=54128 RepID=A0ABD2X3Y2_9HYME